MAVTPQRAPTNRVSTSAPAASDVAAPRQSASAVTTARSTDRVARPRPASTAPSAIPTAGRPQLQAPAEPYGPPYLQRPAVRDFIARMAAKHNVDAAPLTAAFGTVPQRMKPAPTPPGTPQPQTGEDMPFYRYLALFNTSENVQRGVNFYRDHRATFLEAQLRFGVDPEAILGILSVETKFGTVTSRGPVLTALVQRAFDSPRSEYFQSELDAFIGLCADRGWPYTQPQGSSAGAMGYMQFMPSHVRNRMISSTPGRPPDPYNPQDAILSIANYLRTAPAPRAQWRSGEPSAVRLSGDARAQGRVYTVRTGPGANQTERWDLRPNHASFIAYNPHDMYAFTVGYMGRLIHGRAINPAVASDLVRTRP